MAAIYCSDIYCDDCARDIKRRICAELLNEEGKYDLFGLLGQIDSADLAEAAGLERSACIERLVELLDELDSAAYDSDDYPKDCSDDEESDCPQHCGSHGDCLNPEVGSDGTKYGHFFGNSLTSDGDEYVREAVNADLASGRTDSPACEFWMPCYDYLDYNNGDDDEESDG